MNIKSIPNYEMKIILISIQFSFFYTTIAGLEPTQQFVSGFQVHLLNHSDKSPYY